MTKTKSIDTETAVISATRPLRRRIRVTSKIDSRELWAHGDVAIASRAIGAKEGVGDQPSAERTMQILWHMNDLADLDVFLASVPPRPATPVPDAKATNEFGDQLGPRRGRYGRYFNLAVEYREKNPRQNEFVYYPGQVLVDHPNTDRFLADNLAVSEPYSDEENTVAATVARTLKSTKTFPELVEGQTRLVELRCELEAQNVRIREAVELINSGGIFTSLKDSALALIKRATRQPEAIVESPTKTLERLRRERATIVMAIHLLQVDLNRARDEAGREMARAVRSARIDSVKRITAILQELQAALIQDEILKKEFSLHGIEPRHLPDLGLPGLATASQVTSVLETWGGRLRAAGFEE